MEYDVIQQQLLQLYGETEALRVKLWNLINVLDRTRQRNGCSETEWKPDMSQIKTIEEIEIK